LLLPSLQPRLALLVVLLAALLSDIASPLSTSFNAMPEIGATGVSFTHVAREWRCKWTDEAVLKRLQGVLDAQLSAIKAVGGQVSVQRTVCGECNDFKVITKLTEPEYGAWSGADHAPEAAFLAALTAAGGTQVETQTVTFETL